MNYLSITPMSPRYSRAIPFCLILFWVFLSLPAPAQQRWVQTSGPKGWDGVRARTVSDTIFLKAGRDTWHRSPDAGGSWELIEVPGNMSLATYLDGVFLQVDDKQLFRSTDGGATWTNISDRFPDAIFDSTAKFGVHDQRIYACVKVPGGPNAAPYYPCYSSEDGGLTWEPFKADFLGPVPVEFMSLNDSLLIHAGHDTYFRTSTDPKWKTLYDENVPSRLRSRVMGGRLYSKTTTGAVWLYTAETWTEMDPFFPFESAISHHDTLYGILESLVLMSTDHGMSWQTLYKRTSESYNSITSIGFIGSDLVFSVWWNGLYRLPFRGAPAIRIDTAVIGSTSGLLCAGDWIYAWGPKPWPTYRSSDLGATWEPYTEHGIRPPLLSYYSGTATYFLNFDTIVVSRDNGTTWQPIIRDPDMVWEGQPSSVAADGENLVVGYEGRFWVFNESESTWRKVEQEYLGWGVDLRIHDNLWVVKKRSDTALYISENGGISWDTVGAQWPYNFKMEVFANGRIIVVTDYYIYLSDDAGRTWRRRTFPFPLPFPSRFGPREIEMYGTSCLIVGSFGICLSQDYGETWQEFSEGAVDLPGTIELTSTHAFGSCNGLGVWRRELPVPAGVEQHRQRDEPIVHISPNPASEYAVVNLSVRDGESVAFDLVDPQGLVVRTVRRTDLSAGEHAFRVNLLGLPSGAYLLHIRSSEGGTTVPLIVVR